MCWKAALAPDDMTKWGGKLPPYGQKGSVGPKKKSSVLILLFFFFADHWCTNYMDVTSTVNETLNHIMSVSMC